MTGDPVCESSVAIPRNNSFVLRPRKRVHALFVQLLSRGLRQSRTGAACFPETARILRLEMRRKRSLAVFANENSTSGEWLARVPRWLLVTAGGLNRPNVLVRDSIENPTGNDLPTCHLFRELSPGPRGNGIAGISRRVGHRLLPEVIFISLGTKVNGLKSGRPRRCTIYL